MSSPLKIVFCGTPEFAVPSLQVLLDAADMDVQLVITQPDKPVGREQTLKSPPVKVCAEHADIPVWQPEKLSKNFDQCPCPEPPDFLVVVAYGQILRQHILDWPTVAPVNVHASLLPRWRGASPMQHTLLAGDKETGMTIQRMVRALDEGPILAQKTWDIPEGETIERLHDYSAEKGAELLLETLRAPLSEVEQDDANATLCHKLSRETGNVDPETMTAEEIQRHIYALVPWPGVTCPVHGEHVKLLKTSLQETEGIALTCKDDTTLYIQQLQSAGRKPLSAVEWLHGKQSQS